MPMIISRREAVQISTNQKKVLRRSWHSNKYMKGQKISVILDVDEGKKGAQSPFALEVLGIIEHRVCDMDDKRAKEEGFRNLSEWKSHWETMYRGTARVNEESRVFALRIRKTEHTHVRPKLIDSPV